MVNTLQMDLGKHAGIQVCASLYIWGQIFRLNTTLVYIIHYCKGLWLTVFYKEFGRGPSGYVWQPTKTTKRKKWCEKESQQKLNAYSSTHQKTTDQSKTLTTCKDPVFSWLRGKHILNNFSFHRSTNKNIPW